MIEASDRRQRFDSLLARLPDHPSRHIHELLPWNWRPPRIAHAAYSQSAIRPKRPDQGRRRMRTSDFNPIENAFAKLKALLRQAAKRTVEGLWTAKVASLIASQQPNAATTSSPQDTLQHDRRML